MEEIAFRVRLPLSDGDTRLHRVADDAVVGEFHPHGLRGAGECGLDLGAVMAEPVYAEIGAHGLVEDGCVRRIRFGSSADGRQRLVLDLDELGGVARPFRRFGHHKGDRIADIAHPVRLEDGAAGIGHARPARARHVHLAG